MTAIDERALEAAARAMCAPFDPDERVYLGAYMKRWESHKDSARLAITAYLQALSPGSIGETEGWQPIETFDGSEAYVLVFDGSYVSEARYHPNEDGWWLVNAHPTDAYDGEVYPTHWRPLPSPPSPMLAAAGGREG